MLALVKFHGLWDKTCLYLFYKSNLTKQYLDQPKLARPNLTKCPNPMP